jgi:hypothetical protein
MENDEMHIRVAVNMIYYLLDGQKNRDIEEPKIALPVIVIYSPP